MNQDGAMMSYGNDNWAPENYNTNINSYSMNSPYNYQGIQGMQANQMQTLGQLPQQNFYSNPVDYEGLAAQAQVNASTQMPSIFTDYDSDSTSNIKVVNKIKEIKVNNPGVSTTLTEMSSVLPAQSKQIKVTKSTTEANSIAKSEQSYKSYLKKLKNFGKTRTLKVESSAPSATSPFALKPSLKKQFKHTSVKVESLNNNYSYSKTDTVSTCNEIIGWYTVISNIEGKNLKFVSDLEIKNDHFYLYESRAHKQVYLDLKFSEIDFSSLDKLVNINDLNCIEVSNLYGEVVYVCDEDSNRIMDLTDNIKLFMTNCKSSVVKYKLSSPTLDDQIKQEKSELSTMLNKLQEAIKRKNSTIKEEYTRNRKKLMNTQDKQMQTIKQRLLLEQVIQARENEEYRQIEKLISELELQKEKEKVSNIISEVEKSKQRQKKLIEQEQDILNSHVENRISKVQTQIMDLAVNGDKQGDYKKCSNFSGDEKDVKTLMLKNDQEQIFGYCTACCEKELGLFNHLEKFKCRTACKDNLVAVRKSIVNKILEGALNKELK